MALTKISQSSKTKRQLKPPTIQDLYEAGAHFGHLKSASDARSKDFVFTYRNRVAIINLEETISSLERAINFISDAAKSGKQFLVVGTKLQARQLIQEMGRELGIPYVIERWPGGLISNFKIIVKSIKRMRKTEKEIQEGKYSHLKKKECLKIEKDLVKTQKIFGGLRNLEKKPEVVLVVDGKKEANALKECRKEGVGTIVVCDTNSNPQMADYPIVANDDSTATLKIILGLVKQAIQQNYRPKSEDTQKVADRLEGELDQAKAKPKKQPVKS